MPKELVKIAEDPISPAREATLLVAQRLAEKALMTPANYVNTIKTMCITPNKRTQRELLWEEVASFMMVCDRYDLDPLRKEIHAFQSQAGMIVPVVAIDGWIRMVHRDLDYDGEEWEMHHDDKGALLGATCIIYHKSRQRPTKIYESFIECYRPTDPWKQMPTRMIRHKSFIQAARYAFNFGGVYDEDEARDIVDREEPPAKLTSRRPPSPSGAIEDKTIEGTATETQASDQSNKNAAAVSSTAGDVETAGADAHTPEPSAPAATTTTKTEEIQPGDARFDGDKFLDDLDLEFGDESTEGGLRDKWVERAAPHQNDFTRPQKDRLNKMYQSHSGRIAQEIAAAEALGGETQQEEPKQPAPAAAPAEKPADPPAQEMGPGEAQDKAAQEEALKADAKRVSLVKGFIHTLGLFTTEEDLAACWSQQIEGAREDGLISNEDFHTHLVPAHDEAFKRIKAGLTAPPAGAEPSKPRRRPPAAPAEAGPAATTAPATPTTKPIDPQSNAGQADIDLAFKKGRMAAGGSKPRTVPDAYQADPELNAAWLRGWDSNKPPSM